MPELFSAPVLERVLERQQHDEVAAMPFFDGLLAGEPDALVDSFAGEPRLDDPVRGRIEGERPFRAFVADMGAWLARRNASVENLGHVVLEQRGFEEAVLHLDGTTGRIELPFALVADHRSHGLLDELRLYYRSRPLTGERADRPALLVRDPDLRASDVVADHQRAIADGDVDAVVATFEADGYVREPAGGEHAHRGADALRAFYEQLLCDGGGIGLDLCALVDDGRTCALEYNVVRWGATELAPRAGVGVYVRGSSGKLAAARLYGDADPISARSAFSAAT